MALSEFELIQRYFNQPSVMSTDIDSNKVIVKGIGDDCAILNLPHNTYSALSIDTLVSGVHFPKQAKAIDVGRRALSVSLSDLAAMGADPSWFSLAITLPDMNSDWLEGFSRGLFEVATRYQCQLIGGDTTRGPLTITVQVGGVLSPGKELYRHGAMPGNEVYISGYLGDGAAGLIATDDSVEMSSSDRQYLLDRFYSPTPRFEVSRLLRDIATSAIDVSDGLVADAGHIAKASGVRIELDANKLPISSHVNSLLKPSEALNAALSGGDDYELCVTVPEGQASDIKSIQRQTGVMMTKIGRVVVGEGVLCLDQQGRKIELSQAGYQHF